MMQIATLRKHLLLLPLSTLLLVGCWGSLSQAATVVEERYASAVAVEKRGDRDGAEKLYRQLLADYPKSIEAEKAERQVERIALHRKLQSMQPFMPVLHRLRKIVLSYQELTGELPRQLADFDRADFFFASDHLARVVPVGSVAYLKLLPEKNDFMIFALMDDNKTGYLVDRSSAALHPVDPATFKARLDNDLKVVERKGNLLLIR